MKKVNNPDFHYPFSNWDNGIDISWLFWIITIVQVIAVLYIPFAMNFGLPLSETTRELGIINLIIASIVIMFRVTGAITLYIIEELKTQKNKEAIWKQYTSWHW